MIRVLTITGRFFVLSRGALCWPVPHLRNAKLVSGLKLTSRLISHAMDKLICATFVCLFTVLAAANAAPLDIRDYLQQADAGTVYPSARQREMLSAFLPDRMFQPAPPIGDRAFWRKIAATDSGRELLREAGDNQSRAPEVPIPDGIYREASRTGNRDLYRPRYYDTMERLETFILAECIENEGRFLPRITEYLWAILAMKSWLHPNHDKDSGALDGKYVLIDLGARRFGSDLALAQVLLGDKLPVKLRDEISAQLRWRIYNSYIEGCLASVDSTRMIQHASNAWVHGSSNWNAVCTSGSIFTILTTATDPDLRLAAVGSALNSMRHYLAGFGDDGYCSEGFGYWGYGFGAYMLLAHVLWEYSEGRIDLFAFDNPEKLRRIARFPELYQVQNGLFPVFSDSPIRFEARVGNFAKAVVAKHYGIKWPYQARQQEAVEQLIQWTALAAAKEDAIPPLTSVTQFEQSGIVISRGDQPVPFSIAFKMGHNAENHNHSDVGSYSLLLGDDYIAGDLGSPVYVAGAFAPDNPARSSWGHPVPRIDGHLQSNGRAFFGTIRSTEFTTSRDRIKADLRTAYEAASLIKLDRVVENARAGAGLISITDSFAATQPVKFGTALTTYASYEIAEDNAILLTTDHRRIRVEITAAGARVKITAEPVPVRMKSGKTPTRIGIDFVEPVREGSITVRYQPQP